MLKVGKEGLLITADQKQLSQEEEEKKTSLQYPKKL